MRKASLVALLLLAACSARPSEPVDPVWGKQPCNHCMMLISEPRPAAQVLLPSGERKFFDDIGCMVEWLAQNAGQVSGAWVRAHEGEGWVDAFTARYSAGQRTPMDYGYLSSPTGVSFASLRSEIASKQRARAGGEVP